MSDQLVAQAATFDNTQQSQETDIHAPGGIQTQNLSQRAAADPRFRPRGHYDRLSPELQNEITVSVSKCVMNAIKK
jgi:hypothetical protein